MESGWFQEAMALLTDRRFAAIRRRAEHHPLAWDEFVLLPQPPGAAPAQVWDLLTALRRHTAVELPEYAVDTLGRRGWYSLTRSMRADLADIDRRCSRDSSLAESLRSNAATHFVVASHVNAALTAIGEDGVYLDHKRANEVLLGERRPRTPEEQLLLNTHQVMWELDELADQRCTPQLIRSIHARVAENAPQRLPTPPGLDMGGWDRIPLDAEATLEYVSRFVNGEGVDPEDHPISFALGLLISFTSGRPLPSWNGLMSVLLTRLLFLRSRLPVAAMIPIARVYRAWQDGVIVPPVVPVALHDSLHPGRRRVRLHAVRRDRDPPRPDGARRDRERDPPRAGGRSDPDSCHGRRPAGQPSAARSPVRGALRTRDGLPDRHAPAPLSGCVLDRARRPAGVGGPRVPRPRSVAGLHSSSRRSRGSASASEIWP